MRITYGPRGVSLAEIAARAAERAVSDAIVDALALAGRAARSGPGWPRRRAWGADAVKLIPPIHLVPAAGARQGQRGILELLGSPDPARVGAR